MEGREGVCDGSKALGVIPGKVASLSTETAEPEGRGGRHSTGPMREKRPMIILEGIPVGDEDEGPAGVDSREVGGNAEPAVG